MYVYIKPLYYLYPGLGEFSFVRFFLQSIVWSFLYPAIFQKRQIRIHYIHRKVAREIYFMSRSIKLFSEAILSQQPSPKIFRKTFYHFWPQILQVLVTYKINLVIVLIHLVIFQILQVIFQINFWKNNLICILIHGFWNCNWPSPRTSSKSNILV